eukprot:gb/GECH01006373.1/.p1 GENE.gb/GECH01006373.1/~~gb/GECH01006373.1/.p1  ORF type:complete len:141 (+),score=37.66 gb/GECH01006373.1/:1-423(+)
MATEVIQTAVKAIETQKWEEFSNLLSPEFKHIAWPLSMDSEEMIDSYKMLFAAFPDLSLGLDDVTEDNSGTVTAKFSLSGTHQGVFDVPDIPKVEPTGKTIKLDPEEHHLTVEDGKIKEWKKVGKQTVVFAILDQLGVAV